jgi:hypothetical protein
MIRIFTITLALICTTITAFTQINECGTPDLPENEYMALPWYGDEDDTFLNNFYDSLQTAMGGNPAARGIIQDVWFRIPIHFWIYQINQNTPGGANPNQFPNELSLQRLMDAVNTSFRDNGIKIQFYLDCFSYISNVTGITVDGFVQESLLANAYRQTGKINVHIVDELVGAGGKFNPLYNAIFIPRGVAANMANAETLTHELGHFFGLLHTHFGAGTPCLQEPVTRGSRFTPCPNGFGYSKRCKWTGDLLCDTPADPNMGGDTPFNLRPDQNGCTYVRNQTDQNGDTYNPDVSNFMAYGNIGCRSNFSAGQIKWMYWWLLNVQVPLSSGANWFIISNNTAFDIYEPDNVDIAARTITLGEIQEHSFYGAASGICEDAVDWLRFQYPTTGSSGLLRLEIRDVTTPNPVNEINVYIRNINGTAGARLTNLTTVVLSGYRYIELSCSALIPGQEYLVEITRNQSNIGKYEVALIDIAASLPISGPSLVCASGSTFALNNLPAGTTVTWTATPTNLFAVSSGSDATPTLSAASNNINGQGTLTFTISTGCGSPVQNQKSFWVGRPPADINTLIWTGTRGVNPVNTTPGVTYVFRVDAVPNTSSYTWVLPSGFSVYGGSNTTTSTTIYITTSTISGTYTLHCTANNDCGSSWTNSLTINNGTSGGGGSNCPPGVEPPYKPGGPIPLIVYPNPASSSLIIKEESEDLEKLTNQTEINSESFEFNAQLFDHFGVLRKSGQSKNRKLELGTDDLPNGFYILHIRIQSVIEYRHIRIKH